MPAEFLPIVDNRSNVAALRADTGDQQWYVGSPTMRADLRELLRIGCANNQRAIAVRIPVARDELRNVLVQLLPVIGEPKFLQVAGTGIGRMAENDDALVHAVQEPAGEIVATAIEHPWVSDARFVDSLRVDEGSRGAGAMVAGGASGLGEATARALAEPAPRW